MTGEEDKGCSTGPADFWEQPYYSDEREILGIEIDGSDVAGVKLTTDEVEWIRRGVRRAVDAAEVCEK